MRWVVLLLFTAACTSGPPPGGPPSGPGDLREGVPAIVLHRLGASTGVLGAPDPGAQTTAAVNDGVLLRPDAFGPADGPVADRFGLTLRAALPTAIGIHDARFAPPGLRILVGEVEVPWRLRPGSPDEPGYRVSEGQLLLAWPGYDPPTVLVRGPRGAAQGPGGSSLRFGDTVLAGLRVAPGAPVRVDLPASGELRATLVASDHPLRLRVHDASSPLFTVALAAGERQAIRRSVPAAPLTFSVDGPPGSSVFIGDATVARPPSRPPRRVVWVGLDTLRPDHLGHRGYPRETSPNLDAFARRATVFSGAVAPAPRTRPSFRSALTGLDPLAAVKTPGVLAHLGQAGFATAGFVANPHLDPLLGFGDGADRWELHLGARAADQTARAIAWLRDHADHDAAIFVHYMDPHLPYHAPEPDFERFAVDPDPALPALLSRGEIVARMRNDGLSPRHRDQLIARYDGEIRSLDRALGALFETIDALPGPSLVIVFGDHGEELWDRGGFEHNHSLAPEVVDAVLIVREPGQGRGEVVSGLATLADLLPTTLALLDRPTPSALAGRSLVPALRGEPIGAREIGIGHLMYGEERWMVRTPRWSYTLWTASGREAVYDRRVDPLERHPTTPDPTTLDELRRGLGRAHGAEIGAGWRILIDLREPVVLKLPFAARAAGVIDPEAARAPRANQVWGEVPPIRPEDVASVALSAEGRELRVEPGRVGRGRLWVLHDAPAIAGEVTAASSTRTIGPDGSVDLGAAGSLVIEPGTILVPPRSEVERLRERAMRPAAAPAQLEALRALGYLESDD